MISRMKRNSLEEYFNETVYFTFEEIINKIPSRFNDMKLSEFKNIYKQWRQKYLITINQNEYMTLDDFCYMKAKNAREFTSPTDIKVALIMKKKKFKTKIITEITGISVNRLSVLFKDAKEKNIKITKEDCKIRF